MLYRYLRELLDHAGRWFTSVGILIASIWCVPLVIRRLSPDATVPRWLDQAALSALAAAIAIFVGSYRAWREAVESLQQYEAEARDRAPVVKLGRAEFNGGYSAAPKDSTFVNVKIAEVQNRSDKPIYLEQPTVTDWVLPPTIFNGPGKVTLIGREPGNKGELMRAEIKPGATRFDLYARIDTSFRIQTREDLARVLKQLGDFSVTLRFPFTPAVDTPVEHKATGDFKSFRNQVLNWWEQQNAVQLLRIYGDSNSPGQEPPGADGG